MKLLKKKIFNFENKHEKNKEKNQTNNKQFLENRDVWQRQLYNEYVSSDSSDSESPSDIRISTQNQRKADIRGKIVFDFELSKQSCYQNQVNPPHKTCYHHKVESYPNTAVAYAKTGHATIKKTQSFNQNDQNIKNSYEEYTSNKKCFNDNLFSQKIVKGENTAKLSEDQLSFKLVCYDFKAIEESDLTVHIGQWVRVIDKSDSDWWLVRSSAGDEGYVPSNFLIDVPILPNRKLFSEPKVNVTGPNISTSTNEINNSAFVFKKCTPKVATIVPRTMTSDAYTPPKVQAANNIDLHKNTIEKDLIINQLKKEYRGFIKSNSDISQLQNSNEYETRVSSLFSVTKPEWRRSFSGNQKKVRFLDSNIDFDKCSFNNNYRELVECATWC
ncbi:uncharacterized protein LOC124813823 [Hydra vulgaris]|uniref:uncharacterized protein LOC124813823 n=1 Tax=Hydra vulgaris TaxID=6087 RepID=UPI001F5EAF54|nr:uncharacterized protein LOC124813823 [Hydra vulgaris]